VTSSDKLSDPHVFIIGALVLAVVVLAGALFFFMRKKPDKHLQQAAGSAQLHHDASTTINITIGQLDVRNLQLRPEDVRATGDLAP